MLPFTKACVKQNSLFFTVPEGSLFVGQLVINYPGEVVKRERRKRKGEKEVKLHSWLSVIQSNYIFNYIPNVGSLSKTTNGFLTQLEFNKQK